MSPDKKKTDSEKEMPQRIKVELQDDAFEVPDVVRDRFPINSVVALGIFILLAVIVILLMVLINRGNDTPAEVSQLPSVSSKVPQESSKEESTVSEISQTQVSEETSQESSEEPSEEPSAEPSKPEETSVYEPPEPEIDPRLLVVDRVINRNQSDAENTLKEKGFVVHINKIYSDEVAEGKVVSQNPAYFTLLEEGGEVTLNVSRGSEPKDNSTEESVQESKKTDSQDSEEIRYMPGYEIPILDIAGREKSDAEKILKSQGFKVQTVYMSSRTVRKGYVIEQSPSGGIKQKYGETVTLYVSKGLEVSVHFETNGGAATSYVKTLEYGGKYGSLPVPSRENYDFQGWYLSPAGGQRVTENTVVAQAYDHILYALWKPKPISGWVLDKDVPSGARIAEMKWTYTLTQTISSELPVMGGWKQAGSYWKETGKGTNYYGDFNEGSNVGYNHNDKYYEKYNHPFLSKFDDGSRRRDVTTKLYTYIYWHWCSNVTSVPPESMPVASSYNADIYSPNGNFLGRGVIWEVFESKNDGKKSSDKYQMKIQSRYSYWWNRVTIYVQTYTDYKKYYQYYKVEEKESRTAVKESDTISNVKRYVKYYLP